MAEKLENRNVKQFSNVILQQSARENEIDSTVTSQNLEAGGNLKVRLQHQPKQARLTF